jgi:YegS/Rv2252/BmrU family lipid kinase
MKTILQSLSSLRQWFSPRSSKKKWGMVVINPAAGQINPDLKALNKILRDADFRYEVKLTTEMGDGKRLATQAVSQGASFVAACGGDGTVMDVAAGLIGSQVPLAILPSGTGNVLAKELGIPQNFSAASSLLIGEGAAIREIDVGMLSDHPFLLRLGVGLEAQITRTADREMKDKVGMLAYITATLQAFWQAPISKYTIEINGKVEEVEGLACMVANAGALGIPGLTISPYVQVDDGLLDVFVVRKADLAELSSMAATAMGAAPGPTSIPHWQCSECKLTADPVQEVEVDGEEFGVTPIQVSVLPKALKVIVPA